MSYQICKRCVTDSSDPAVTFDKNGICSCCQRYDEIVKQRGYRPGVSEEELRKTIAVIKENCKDAEYDCIVGLSGGIDSAYMLYTAVKYGLRPLVVHVDSGWNTSVAEQNIEKICSKLQIKLNVYKADWNSIKELQRAYMLSGLANIDVVQDHLFCAALYKVAKENGIKYILNGSNIATEGASEPFSLQHTYRDAWHMKSVYRKKGRGKKLEYPFLGIKTAWFGLPGVKKINILDYVPYSKKIAMDTLTDEFGWEYYGAKHYESLFTRYEQGVYLPVKFGFDKRRTHLSCLIRNGEMSRKEAIEELKRPTYDPEKQAEDEKTILQRLDISKEEWHAMLHSQPVADSEYFGQMKLFNAAKAVMGMSGLDKIKKRLYSIR